jgi:isoleucyl-tRNA synthetase
LSQITCIHPSSAKASLSSTGDFVESSTGTGFVHIAPGHGMEVLYVGLQNGLPVYSPVDDDGCLVHTNDLPTEQQIPSSLLGLSVLEKIK